MRRTPVLHPFLFAAYPVLAFLGHNIEITRFNDAVQPLFLSLAGGIACFLLLWLLLRDGYLAGFLASTLIGLFFAYGHIYDLIEGIAFGGLVVGRHRVLVPLWFIIALLLFWWGQRRRGSLDGVTRNLNLVAGVLLLIPVGQILLYSIRLQVITSQPAPSQAYASGSPALPGPARTRPDIYYIILDSYSRDDMLKKYYKLDNAPFLRQLEEMGFYVARCTQSNYAQTELSLASSLNYNYLDRLSEQFGPENTSRAGLPQLIQHSALRTVLESQGYQIIALDTGYEPTRWRDADLYLSLPDSSDLVDFQETFLRTTAARLVSEGVAFLNLPPDWQERDRTRREQVLFSLEQLASIPSLPGPKFVFAHIITPHWPYIFGPNGEEVHEHQASTVGYRNQVLFINGRILPILENILAQSETPPIIVLQGDHGAVLDDVQRRMSNLNVVYLPGGGDALLYESITPVNTFRVILNHYFGLHEPLLEDISYYSAYEEPYNYQVVENKRAGCDR